MSKTFDGIIGLAVGDALGVPVEFKIRDTYTVAGMIGYGTHNQPAGTWSDDTSMTLATLESIGRLGKIDADDIMNNFSKWLHTREFTPWGKVFDIGRTTYLAIKKYESGIEALKCGGEDEYSNGNGSLMRILPLAFIPCSVNDINNVSGLTHAHDISKQACRLYIYVAEQLLKGKTIEEIVSEKDVWVNEFSKNT